VKFNTLLGQSQLGQPRSHLGLPPGVPPPPTFSPCLKRGLQRFLPISTAMLELRCAAAGNSPTASWTLVPRPFREAAGTLIPAQRCGHFTKYSALPPGTPGIGPALLVFSDGRSVGASLDRKTDCGLPATAIPLAMALG